MRISLNPTILQRHSSVEENKEEQKPLLCTDDSTVQEQQINSETEEHKIDPDFLNRMLPHMETPKYRLSYEEFPDLPHRATTISKRGSAPVKPSAPEVELKPRSSSAPPNLVNVRKIDEKEFTKEMDALDRFLKKQFSDITIAQLSRNLIDSTKYPLEEFSSWQNALTTWIGKEILENKTPQERGQAVGKVIGMAKWLKEKNNFQGYLMTLSSLNQSYILEENNPKTWKHVPNSEKKWFHKEQKKIAESRNDSYLRSLMEQANGPYVPILSIYKRDIQTTHEIEKRNELLKKISYDLHFALKNSINKEPPPSSSFAETIKTWRNKDCEDELYEQSRSYRELGPSNKV